jgi:urease accessory protein
MAWHARLDLDYRAEPAAHGPRTRLDFLHEGPLRILQSLYPEGDDICHNVIVHPPSGLVGGDVLDLRVKVGAGAHAFVTTPGATRFYRSEAGEALQTARLQLAEGARLEWLPLEALCFDGCIAHNRLVFDLAPEASLIGWDISCLGLPHADKPFLRGSLRQHLEMPGTWLDRGLIAASDTRLLHGPLGLSGNACLATIFYACGTPLSRAAREQALDAARAVIDAHPLVATAGATSPNPCMVVVRVLAPVVEPAMDLLRKVRGAWREACWTLPANPPRVWAL